MSMRIPFGVYTRVFLLSTALALTTSAAFGQQTTIIARTGDPAPDGNGAFASFVNNPADPDTYQSLGPALNDAGQVALIGFLGNTSGGGSDDSGMFLYDGANIVQVAREGQTSPDGDGKFNRFHSNLFPSINNAGVLAFQSAMTDSASGEFFEWGAYVYKNGILSQVIRQGDASPDGDSTIQYVGIPAINGQGGISMGCKFEASDPLGDTGMLRGDLDAGTVEVVARDLDAPPDGDGIFVLMSGGPINDAGQVAFTADINGSSTFDDEGLFRVEPDGSLTRVERLGDPSPDGSGTFSYVRSAAHEPINEKGQVAFAAFTSDGNLGVFLYDNGPTITMARTGQPGPGGVFVDFGVPGQLVVTPALNDAGQVAFFGYIENSSGVIYRGIYRSDGTPSGITEIVRQGRPSPDGDGVFILNSQSTGWDSNDFAKMNEAGQVAFFTNVTTSYGGNEGIFLYDDDQGLMKVARVGDPRLGSTITELRFTSKTELAHSNNLSGLNNLGQVAYAFELADGSGGIAIWSPPGITPTGDLDGDGDVDFSDLGALLASYDACAGDANYNPDADFDDSGCIDLSDLGALLANYGTGI